jgi:biopolymer transport protein ExbB
MQTIHFDFSLFRQGGLIMWPILILAVTGILIFVERLLYLHKGQIRTDTFIAGIRNLLDKNRLVEALTVCEETPGPVAAVIKAALLNRDKGRDPIVGAIQGAALVQIPALERRVAAMQAIARVAPLLGLLGTVLGMMDALFGIHAGGAYANMGTVSGGFASALIATAFGIAVAAMAHLAFHFLNGRVHALVNDMEYAGHEIVQMLLVTGVHQAEGAPSVPVVQAARKPVVAAKDAKANG